LSIHYLPFPFGKTRADQIVIGDYLNNWSIVPNIFGGLTQNLLQDRDIPHVAKSPLIGCIEAQ
jgi:hypothetical protein